MNKPETLSALLDNEGSQEELATLGLLAGDAQARGVWYRYQLIGDMLREGGSGVAADSRFADGVQRRLADEALSGTWTGDSVAAPVIPLSAARRPAGTATPTPGRAVNAWRPALGLAAAASVTAFMLGLWTAGPGGDGPPVASLLPSQAPTTRSALEPMPTAVQAVASSVGQAEQVSSLPEAEYRRRMDDYLMNFNEQRARMGMPQAHAYVRVVGFDSPNEQP